MIGDRILVKPVHKVKANLILSHIVKNYFCKKMIITIGGESGTGKTEIAYLLQELLWEKHKIRTKVIHIDDYYKTMWQDRNKVRKKLGIRCVGVKEIDWKELSNTIKMFKSNGRFLKIQRIHKYTNTLEKTITDNKSIDILILEGLYACVLKETDLNVFLEGSIKDTDKFRKERHKEDQTKFRLKVLKKEAKDVLKTKKKIDIFVKK